LSSYSSADTPLVARPSVAIHIRQTALAASVCAAVALLAAGGASATFPGRNGLIAFASDRDPLLLHEQIFSLDVGSGEFRNLSGSPAEDSEPALSPDGKTIAFVRDNAVWLMNSDGSDQRFLVRSGYNDPRPVWSPDGRAIAFNSGGPGDCPPGAYRCGHLVAVWTIRVDGTGLRRHGASTRYATWSPNGQRLAYEAAVDPYGTAHGILVKNAGGTKARLIARFGTQPAWSPRGRLIAYDGRGITVVESDGTRRRRVAGGRFPLWSPQRNRLAFSCGKRRIVERAGETSALCVSDIRGRPRLVARGVLVDYDQFNGVAVAWSPDGRRLAYVGADGVFVVDSHGRHATRIVRKPRSVSVSALTWSVDGRHLVLTQRRDGNDLEIYTMAPDGSGIRQLTNNSTGDLQPTWTPDGKRIAFVRTRTGGHVDIWTMRAEGGDGRLVARNGVAPSWTADGNRIVFFRYIPPPYPPGSRMAWTPYSVFSVSADGGDERLVVEEAYMAAPSPDGRNLAFLRWPTNPPWSWQLMVSTDGGNPAALTRASGAMRPSWSPDSTMLAFAGGTNDSGRGIYTIRADGTELRHVAETPGAGSASFSPDGTQIVFDSGFGRVEVSGVDGSGRTVIAETLGRNGYPDWQPLPG
jgi:Tol biopolymer transport system component